MFRTIAILSTALGLAGAAEPLRPAKRAKDAAPELHFLAPGFRAVALPLKLTNLVNLQYRADGALVCLGYNGNIWVARDTDGDGLEDQVKLFWEGKGKVSAPIGMDLAPAGYKHGKAVFFACKGKIMMVTDRDGDDVADEAKTLAEGWPAARAGIDAAAVCFDAKDGSLYYGLGVRWYDNAYELDAQGKAHNDLTSVRGAIHRLSSDFSTSEKLCTGVRWPVGLRFNAQGDLFCSDQEGATWLPNGNPFDELLQIQRGRHYGFPPQHPVHLPNVVDEPSVYDYGPQHQSTCGMRFNTPNAAGASFGPAAWQGDLFVTGQSRGKIYRTKLVKTDEGYVAQNSILACLNQLAVDLAFTPDAKSLLLATHSGEPDWGTGPEGAGTIFKITYQPGSPQVLAAWQSTPTTFQVRFDAPLVGVDASRLAANLEIWRGEFVQPGERYETMWPGYEVIKQQQAAPLDRVPLENLKISADQQGITLTTAAQTTLTQYSVRLPVAETAYEVGILPHGLLGGPLGWLPHPEAVFSATPQGSSPASLETQVDLRNLLRPVLQPGTRLGYEAPAEEVTLCLQCSSSSFSGMLADQPITAQRGHVSWDAFITLDNKKWPFAALKLQFPPETTSQPSLKITYHTKADSRPRALPLRRFLLPWITPQITDPLQRVPARPEIAGGSWAEGRDIFYGTKAQCGACHAVRGQGKHIGPDLSNQVSRDYASVWKDIQEPSASINPDYVTHQFTLAGGQTIQAVRRPGAESGKVILGIGAGAEIPMAESEITKAEPQKASLMPAGLTETLTPAEIRSLMAFILTEPPLVSEKPPIATATSRAALEKLVAGAPPAVEAKKMRIVLVAGAKDHGPGEHDYPAWQAAWSRLMTLAEQTEIMLATDWPSPEQLAVADALVFYRKGDWSAARAASLDPFLKAGKGAVFIHWAVEGGVEAAGLAERIGYGSNQKQTKYRHGEITWDFPPTEPHPITRNFAKVTLTDETYWQLVPGLTSQPTILAQATEDGTSHPQCWINQPAGGGRVFVTLGGHYSTSFDNPEFRVLLLRGIAWAGGAPVDRFSNLVKAGLPE